jgi:hypothetical protein
MLMLEIGNHHAGSKNTLPNLHSGWLEGLEVPIRPCFMTHES